MGFIHQPFLDSWTERWLVLKMVIQLEKLESSLKGLFLYAGVAQCPSEGTL